ncbi:MAG: histone deacetylase family protein [Nitrososphaerota archaeon]|nr:histone deacetylase family protein [Nitrososphaerota archaeon]
MKIVYHEDYCKVYSSDPAAQPGRIESIYNELKGIFEFIKPDPATEEDLRLVHSDEHIKNVKVLGLAYEIAILAVGGAIKAAELAFMGEPSFALIRPPGHHASRDSAWGFCYFNNIAIAIEWLRRRRMINSALIIDIDLHYGDGTANIFKDVPMVSYLHLTYDDSIRALSDYLNGKRGYDIIAVSAGFDRHIDDWGGMWRTEDYEEIGRLIKLYAKKECKGRRFAILEGGYNLQVLGKNVKALLKGME